MPSPRDPLKTDRKSRRQDTMPGGWLWIVVLLLLTGVLYITFGLPSTSSLDYSDFIKLVKERKVAKVTFSEGASSKVAEFDDSLKKQIRNNRAEVVLWKGDVDSGVLSKMLEDNNIPRKTERSFS